MKSNFSAQYSILRRKFPEAPAQFEQLVNRVYSSVLSEGAVSIDCGAHVGKHTLPMARCVGHTGTVYAFEPIKEKLEKLIESATQDNLQGIIQARNAAVSDKEGLAQFNYVKLDPGKSSIHLRQDLRKDTTKMDSNIVTEVEVVTIDCTFQKSHCEFLKIDVEGAELAAMVGGYETISKYQPVIHFEMGEPSLEAFGVSPEQIYDYLTEKCGYTIFDILGRPLTEKETYMRSASATGAYDYFALPNKYSDPELIKLSAFSIFGRDILETIHEELG